MQPSSSSNTARAATSSSVDWDSVSDAELTAAFEARMAELGTSNFYALTTDHVPSLVRLTIVEDNVPVSSSPGVDLIPFFDSFDDDEFGADPDPRTTSSYVWSITMRERQRLYHAEHGNGPSVSLRASDDNYRTFDFPSHPRSPFADVRPHAPIGVERLSPAPPVPVCSDRAPSPEYAECASPLSSHSPLLPVLFPVAFPSVTGAC